MSENCIEFDCDCCHNELNLDKLCCKKAKIKKACIKDLNVPGTFCANILSSPNVCADQVTSRKLDAQSACLMDVNAANACFQNVTATNLGVSNLVANEACIPGPLRVANLLNCGKYRATVAFSAPISYTLGSNVNFNMILDDPNGNVSFSPTAYTTPVSGYYMLMYKLNVQNLMPASGSPILGSPVGNLEVYVNGVLSRELFSPMLTFFNNQKSILSAMISLKAGDVVTFVYKVLVVDQVSGVSSLAGTVDIQGNGTELNDSMFKIHLLSVDCNDMPCAPSIPCQPCQPMICVPCVPSNNCDCGCSKPPA